MYQLPPISADLRRDFQRDNYVLVQRALPSELIARWRQEAEQLARYARTIRRVDNDFKLVYRVLTGEVIQQHWPELFAFYTDGSVLKWVKDVTGENAIYLSRHLQSAVNVNIMEGADSVYRWHFDAVPYTALLYLTDALPDDGGAVELVANCEPHQVPDLRNADVRRVWPKAGMLLLMDGTRCYHRVDRLLRPVTRYSVPLVYPNREDSLRPAGLDDYLFDTAR